MDNCERLKALGLDDPRLAVHVRRAATQRLAQESLLDFGRMSYPWFEAPAHICYLAGLLEAVERGEIRRLAISAPPGHGKSTLLQAFLAWFLGRDPRRRILALSASESLARRNSRAVRAIVQSEPWPWPEVTLPTEAVDEWETTGGGGVRSVGVSGNVTGFRAELVLCDDVQPDPGSDVTRDTLEEWFRGVLSTRLEPNGVVVVINTRWHDDDLLARLAAGESGNQWMFVNLPAIAEANDVLGRAIGEALWPARWPLEMLLQRKSEVGSAAFGAQYLGDPAPADGAVFRAEWFEHRYDTLPRYQAQAMQSDPTETLEFSENRARQIPSLCIQACDSAWKAALHNDRSVVVTLTSDLRHIFIADVWFGRVEYPDLRRAVIDQFHKWRPSRSYVEEASSGYAVLADLRASTGIPIVGVRPSESKIARVQAVTGLFESGRVKFPKNAPWMNDLLGECLRFPAGRHDDIVDALVLGVQQMRILMRRQWASHRYNAQLHSSAIGWMGR